MIPSLSPVLVILAGDPHVDPGIVWSAELGYNRSLAGGATLDLAAFYTHSADLISLPSTVFPMRAAPPAYPFLLGASANIGSYEVYGIEASLAGQVDNAWHWRLAYTLTEVDEHVPDNAGGVYRWPRSLGRSTPTHKASAQLSYERGRWL